MVIHMSQIGSKRISQHFGTGIFVRRNTGLCTCTAHYGSSAEERSQS